MNKDDTKEKQQWELASSSQTAIFLWNGFMFVMGMRHSERTDEQRKLYDKHFDGLGMDGGAYSVGYVAAAVDEEFAAKWDNQQDFPSVYHYDIVEPLGMWWVKEGPPLDKFQYGPADREPALKLVVDRYNEMMAGWLVEDKLTQGR